LPQAVSLLSVLCEWLSSLETWDLFDSAATHSIGYFNMIQIATQTNTMLNVFGDGGAIWRCSGNDDETANFEFLRARVAAGTQTPVLNGDILKKFVFEALGADNYAAPAGSVSSAFRIEVEDPSPSTTSMGGRFVFSTCAEGTVELVDRVVVDHLVCIFW
jgi:hypothetical protein